MKICSKCNQEKLESEFYIDKRREQPTCWCRVCYLQYYKEYYKRPSTQSRLNSPDVMECRNNREKIRSQSTKKKESNKIHRAKLESKIRLKEYHQKPETKNHYRQYRIEYKNRPEVISHSREYNRRPEVKERTKINRAKYRAKLRNIPGKLSQEEVQKLIFDSKNICFWCDKTIPEGKLHLDHFMPLTKGGENVIRNIVVSCQSCNCHKSNKHPEAFLEEILQEQKSISQRT